MGIGDDPCSGCEWWDEGGDDAPFCLLRVYPSYRAEIRDSLPERCRYRNEDVKK